MTKFKAKDDAPICYDISVKLTLTKSVESLTIAMFNCTPVRVRWEYIGNQKIPNEWEFWFNHDCLMNFVVGEGGEE